jgi:xylulokinase
MTAPMWAALVRTQSALRGAGPVAVDEHPMWSVHVSPYPGTGGMTLVGIDVGTSALKVAVVTVDGTLVADVTQPYPPQPYDGFIEQDATGWWHAAREALRRACQGRPVRAVAVTGQAPSLVAVDAAGEPCGPALTWADRRAAAEAQEIATLVPGRADAFFGTAKLLWWRRRGDLARARQVLAANGFITARLTGAATLDESTAGLLQGWGGGFPPALAEAVPVALLPDAVACTGVVGSVTPAAAAECGLPAGVPVVAGAIDAVTAALEAGTVGVGDPTTVMTGSSTVTVTAVPRGERRAGLIATRHAVPGLDLLITATVTAGSVIDWVRRIAGIGELPRRLAELPATRPSRLLLSPAWGGERTPTWDADARGVVSGLDLATGPADLLLAAYEGTAFALADNLDVLGLPAGAPLRACGTAASSRVWLQITADVIGRQLARPVLGRGAAAGAALLAGVGAGALGYDDVRRLAAPVAATAEPDPVLAAAYRQRLADWRRLRDAASR